MPAGWFLSQRQAVNAKYDRSSAHEAYYSNKNKRQYTMHIHAKVRQAGMILFATAVVLILPNLSRLIS